MSEEQNLETQEVQEQTENLDTREIIAREFDKLEQAEAEKTNESSNTEKSAEPSGRDDKGRFAAKQTQEPQQDAPKDEPNEAPEASAQEDQPKRNPFASWKKEAKSVLSALPPETQKYIIDRESQFHKGIQQYKDDAVQGRSFKAVVAPHAEYLQQLNVTPEQAFNGLIEAEKKLRNPETRTQAFLRLAHDYGVDINSLTQTPFDPYKYQLEQQLSQQQAMLNQLSQSRQMAEEAQLGQTIEQFAQQHEYFDEVRETMADLLDKGLASDLNDAYAKAVRLNDDVFGRLQQSTMQNTQVQRANEAAKAAKASAVSVKGSPTGITRAPEPKSTEEAVRLAMAQMGL